MTLQLVQAGATGFAVVMLTLGYRLLKQVLSMKEDRPQLLGQRLRAVYTFLGVTVLMTVVGLAGQFISHEQESEIVIGVTPLDVPLDHVRVLHGTVVVKRDAGSGRGLVSMRFRDELGVDISRLVFEQRALNTVRAEAIVAGTVEGGFDDPK